MSEQGNIKISIIVVNYNVSHFLEQCLYSVYNALNKISGEVIVVDNNSIDDSLSMVAEKFPQTTVIANKTNTGFSKANNQGINISKGEYVLLLNPDTIVEEDTFEKVVQFMDEQQNAGALGVRMVDGRGKFLPESKRGLPTPLVAFSKIFGLSKLFPKSKLFGGYHLGYLSEFKINKVDVLSGAFMLLRKKTLNKIGTLDEAFFMYGEDIDLSYRVTLGGYDNYYYPETTIIHYKGESTKKSSVNYVFVFYRAMVIFANKHFKKGNAKLFSFLINIAIYFRAFLAISSRFIKKITLPLIDFLIVLGGLWLLTNHWEKNQVYFSNYVTTISIPSYLFIWFISLFYNGSFDKPFKLKNLFKGVFWGTLIILVFYGLLPKSLQFSRLFIFVGAAWLVSYFLLSRTYLHFIFPKIFRFRNKQKKKFAIVGSLAETKRIEQLLEKIKTGDGIILHVGIEETLVPEQIGRLSQLDQICFIHHLEEVIFCAGDVKSEDIISWMCQLSNLDIEFKIALENSDFLVGSNSIESRGELVMIDVNKITKTENMRKKRTFDFLFSLIALLTAPICMFLFKSKKKFLFNLFEVLVSRKSVIGYQTDAPSNTQTLPKIKPGILPPKITSSSKQFLAAKKTNLIYARDYQIGIDIKSLMHSWKHLDN